MRTIDFDDWDRAGHYAFFMRMDIPQYNVGANLDISRFLPGTKARGLAFSFAATFAVAAAINEVDAGDRYGRLQHRLDTL